MGKILRRCDICKKFHAAYTVAESETVTRYYCYDCWKAKFGSLASAEPVQNAASTQQSVKPENRKSS